MSSGHTASNKRSRSLSYYRRLELWLAGGLCVVALGVWIWFRLYTGIVIEDALITYRYAQNIALGNGFVFNLGEHVLGTTSPLFTLVLAMCGFLFGVSRIPTISTVLMIPTGIAAGWLTFLALRNISFPRWLTVFSLAVFLFNRDILWAMTGGLETPLVLLLMAASLYFITARRWLWAGAVSALLVLARIDGVIWSAGIFAVILWQERRAFLKSIALASAIVLPWIVFAFLYFGTPIPNTVDAKSTIGIFGYLTAGLNAASYGGWGLLYLSRISPFGRLIGIVLFALGAWTVFRQYRSPALQWLVIYPFVFLFAYYVGHAPKFPWYPIPVLWSALITGAIGLWEAGRIVAASVPVSMKNSRVLRWAAFAFFVVFGAAMGARGVTTAHFHHDWMEEELHVRKPLALWLRDYTPTDATVAMEAIGYQGYYSGRRIIDFAGLVSPEVVRLYRESRSNAQVLWVVLKTFKPDYVVLRTFETSQNQSFLGGALFDNDVQREYFQSHYEVVKQFHPYREESNSWMFDLVVYERTAED